MLRNYVKVALRSILSNKLTSFINISGLALAIACAIMIYLYVADETSYDRYSSQSARTYRISRDFLSQDGTANLRLANIAPPIGPLLKNDFGAIGQMARTLQNTSVISVEENGRVVKAITEDKVFNAEPGIIPIFDIQFLSGNPESSLTRPFTAAITEEMAIKYFGTVDAIGKRLRADNRFDFEVTGVYRALPPQSHWHPDFLLSFVTLEDSTVYGRRRLETNWGNNAFGTYVVLQEGENPAKLEAQFPAFLDRHFGPYAKQNYGAPPTFVASKATELHIQAISEIHLKSHRDDELEANGNINNVYMISIIGIFIVLIACFSFVNLSTARATRRAKEVGLRKVVGAFRNQLIGQYLSESIMMALFALVIAIAFSYGSLGWLNDFTKKTITIQLTSQWPMALGLLAFAVMVGLIAGIYPAFVISSFRPAEVLKSEQGTAVGKGGIRKVLVVAQFAISIGLIIATSITSQQLDYMNNRNLGYDRDRVITLPYYSDLSPEYNAFYNQLTGSSSVKNVTRSSRVPTGRLLDSYGGASILKGDSLTPVTVSLKSIAVDHEFFDAYGVGMAAGRNFSKAIPTDDSLAFIINEEAARQIGWKDPSAEINREFRYAGVRGKLIGVVRDFHFESLHQQIVPMIFLISRNGNYNNLSVKLSGKNPQASIAHVEKVWKEFLPKRPFDFEFLNQKYDELYRAEQNQGQLFTIFSGIAIFIACLGLFGLATFNTMLRIREIGIRKVLGASVPSILKLLSTEIVLLVLIASVVSWPVVWMLMGGWLDTFAYHINMNVFVYLIAAVVAVVVALATVSVQTFKAAVSNPSKTLRRE